MDWKSGARHEKYLSVLERKITNYILEAIKKKQQCGFPQLHFFIYSWPTMHMLSSWTCRCISLIVTLLSRLPDDTFICWIFLLFLKVCSIFLHIISMSNCCNILFCLVFTSTNSKSYEYVQYIGMYFYLLLA